MSTEAIMKVVSELANSQPDRDIILISRMISRELHYDLSALVESGRQKENCTVFLTTRGGDPDGGYRMARCLQHHYKHIRLVIPSLCKSAGTLAAIGAHELVIGDLGELGPLDVQVRKSSELEERSSGLDIIQALGAAEGHAHQAFQSALISIRRGGRLSTKLAGEFAANLAIGMVAPLYNQIDPHRLGEMQRSLKIALEYGERLNQATKALRPGALDTLVSGYPAHSFVIDRKEAASLFTSVKKPTKEEAEFASQLWHLLGEQVDKGPFFIRDEKPNQGVDHDGIIEGDGEHPPEEEPGDVEQAPGEANA